MSQTDLQEGVNRAVKQAVADDVDTDEILATLDDAKARVRKIAAFEEAEP